MSRIELPGQLKHSSVAFGLFRLHESESLLIVQTRAALGGVQDKKSVLTNSLVLASHQKWSGFIYFANPFNFLATIDFHK